MAAKKTPCNKCGKPRDARSKTGLCRSCHEEASKPADPRIARARELASLGRSRIEIADELGVDERQLRDGELGRAVELGEAGIESLVLERLLAKAGSSTTAASEKLLLEVAGRIGAARRQQQTEIPPVVTLALFGDDDDEQRFWQRLRASHVQLHRELEAARLRIAELEDRLGIQEAEEEPEEDDGITWCGDYPHVPLEYRSSPDEEQKAIYARWKVAVREWAERRVAEMETLPPEPRREDYQTETKYQRLMSIYRELLSAWADR